MTPSQSGGGASDWGSMLPPAEADHEIPDIATMQDDTLPALHATLETVHRSVAAAQMSLAGHTVQTFENPSERRRLLGLPEGKTAFRDATDYLKLSLRIDGTEARRRTRWAATLEPVRTMSGELLPPKLPLLSEAVHDGAVDRVAVDVITGAIDKARQMARRVGVDPQALAVVLDDGEERLVSQALSVDPGTLRKVSDHWLKWVEATVDPDGAEPNDADLPQLQGVIRKGKRNGLHHWHLAVNDEQNEYLLTVVNAATNPRAPYRGDPTAPASTLSDGEEQAPDSDGTWDETVESYMTAEVLSEVDGSSTAVPALDPRSRNQKQLDGLIACLAGGLALIESDKLPSTGGMRPQVAVTIDYRTLLSDLEKAGRVTAEDLRQFESSAAYSGPIHPNTIRTMACDADILPVVLGADGEVLDVGRAQRLFPARMRQAIATRDGGCAAPGCWIPAPWCDVHHVEHWEHGGSTSAANGVLLCNHHHHAVHAGAWDIDMRSGTPWFAPAPYLDPRRQPQRNRYWRR
ncbi:DUF222 domain-containing protein [Citricoccus sp. GCM10030269]